MTLSISLYPCDFSFLTGKIDEYLSCPYLSHDDLKFIFQRLRAHSNKHHIMQAGTHRPVSAGPCVSPLLLQFPGEMFLGHRAGCWQRYSASCCFLFLMESA